MSDTIRLGFIADVKRQTSQLGTDAARIVARVARRLVLRQEAFGPLDLAKLGDWQRWRGRPDERVDEALLAIAEEIAAEDREQEEQHERDRDEVVGDPAVDSDAPAATFLPRIGEPGDLLTGKLIVVDDGKREGGA